jgi:hypothetical protein
MKLKFQISFDLENYVDVGYIDYTDPDAVEDLHIALEDNYGTVDCGGTIDSETEEEVEQWDLLDIAESEDDSGNNEASEMLNDAVNFLRRSSLVSQNKV